jgi:N-sulfoglucosamine sulfohydrolase
MRTVSSYIQRPSFELFDLQSDPAESKNLADDPKFASQLEQMKSRLKTLQTETDDPWVMKWDYE